VLVPIAFGIRHAGQAVGRVVAVAEGGAVGQCCTRHLACVVVDVAGGSGGAAGRCHRHAAGPAAWGIGRIRHYSFGIHHLAYAPCPVVLGELRDVASRVGDGLQVAGGVAASSTAPCLPLPPSAIGSTWTAAYAGQDVLKAIALGAKGPT